MLQSSRREKCDSFKLDDTMQRKRKCAYLSLCLQQGPYHNLSRNTKRGFSWPQIVSDRYASGATRNEDKPDPCEVKLNKGMEKKKNGHGFVLERQKR